MKRFADLVDIEELTRLCESFTALTGMVTAILDLDGNILVATGWQDICTRFHRVNPSTAQRCLESDTILAGQLSQGCSYNVYRCKNGLVDVAVPIHIGGEHVANLFTGQFFFDSPDYAFFKRQAEQFQFDRASYLDALSRVPVVSEQKIRAMMDFFTRLAQWIGEMGLANAKLEQSNRELSRHQEHLEELVAERTAELLKTEAYAQRLLNASADGLFGVDYDGRVTFINPAACEILGYPAERLIGRSFHALMQARQADGSPNPYEASPAFNALKRGEEVRVEHEVYWHADGHAIPVMYSTHPIIEDGKIVGAVTSFVDMTLQRQALAARESALAAAESLTKARSDFLANMSHEIRTPMNAVLGLTQLLEEEALSPEQFEKIASIKKAGLYMLDIVNDILDFSKIEAGQLRIDKQPFSLSDLLAYLSSVQGAIAREKGLGWRIEAPPIERNLLGDSLRVKQVLMNLVNNAIKFTDHGDIQVKVIPKAIAERSLCLRFEVCDSGIGIADEALKTLFMPFMQADSSTSRRYGGTGLGLSICKRLVELMGGELGVDSQVGVGSLFWFELVFELSDLPVAAAKQRTERLARLQGRRILIVDDSEINLQITQAALKRVGAICTLVSDGLQAVDCVRQTPDGFDLVLMDMQMPVMDGFAATRAIRALGLIDLPIIAFSAGVMQEEKQAMLDAGVNDLLAKPADFEKLTAVLSRWL